MNIYLDVETIPDPRFKEDIAVSPPGNMSKPETLEAWHNGDGKYAGEKEKAVTEAFKKLSFDGTRGQIFCIGWAIDESEPCAISIDGLSEAGMLAAFMLHLRDIIYATPGRPETLKWVGHYITGFDLRFIWQRCVINGVRPSIPIPYDAKPWADSVFDTCVQWKGSSSSSGSLDVICKAFGIEGKGDMDGSMVYEAYLAGEYQKIVDYCKEDVRKVRELHRRMTFSSNAVA